MNNCNNLQSIQRLGHIIFNTERVRLADHVFGFDARNHNDFAAELIAECTHGLNAVTKRHQQVNQQYINPVQLQEAAIHVGTILCFPDDFS
ncbi:hypothetical protein D3C73_1369200 [compost metagenome]